MRQQYHIDDYSSWLRYYADQANQTGYGDAGYYRGSPYQRGGGLGSFFRSLFRMAVPAIKTAATHIGRQALNSGVDIAQDVLRGKPIESAVHEHGREGISKLIESASNALRGQSGRGLGKRPKPIKVNQKPVDIFNKKPKKCR